MDLSAKEDLDFGATKVEMELRHWQWVISLTTKSVIGLWVLEWEEHQTKVMEDDTLNHQKWAVRLQANWK